MSAKVVFRIMHELDLDFLQQHRRLYLLTFILCKETKRQKYKTLGNLATKGLFL